jgi:bifunctional non-homologous end joining protein LigD
VGTGFTSRTLAELSERLAPLERRTPAIENAPRSARGRAIHWVEPTLVAEVAFSEWTADGSVRHPSFQGLREDKPASDVRREEPAPTTPPKESGRASSNPSKAASKSSKSSRRSKGARAPAAESTPGSRPGSTRKSAAKAASSAEAGPARIGGVAFTHPERVIYPESGVTKAALARYWESVSPVALPLMRERPLTLIRCPGGIDAPCFLQRHAGKGTPDAVPRVTVPDKKGKAKEEPYLYVSDLESLLSLVHVGVLELHVWNARVDRLDRPDTIVMDLDPAPDVPWGHVVEGARALRDLLEEMGLVSWPRATGGKGLHVVAPIARRAGWDAVAAFTRGLARLMARHVPDRFVAVATKKRREGKIYVDYLRNAAFASAIATFSPRNRTEGTVAFPLTWDEVERAKRPPLLTVRDAAKVDWAERDPWKGYGASRRPVTRAMLRAVGAE